MAREHWLDRFARAAAGEPLTRRGLLARLGGIVAATAGVAVLRDTDTALAGGNGPICVVNQRSCCGTGQIFCGKNASPPNGCVNPLTSHSNCGACFHACKSTEVCVNGQCVPTCTQTGGRCESGNQCCSGYCPEGQDFPVCNCAPQGHTCETASQCCRGICEQISGQGFCQCLNDQDRFFHCSTSFDCCTGFRCLPLLKHCVPCGGFGDPCSSKDHCCSSDCIITSGTSGTCGCQNPGARCVNDSQCCGGAGFCVNGICQGPPAGTP